MSDDARAYFRMPEDACECLRVPDFGLTATTQDIVIEVSFSK